MSSSRSPPRLVRLFFTKVVSSWSIVFFRCSDPVRLVLLDLDAWFFSHGGKLLGALLVLEPISLKVRGPPLARARLETVCVMLAGSAYGGILSRCKTRPMMGWWDRPPESRRWTSWPMRGNRHPPSWPRPTGWRRGSSSSSSRSSCRDGPSGTDLLTRPYLSQ